MKKLLLLILSLFISQTAYSQVVNPNVAKKITEKPKLNFIKKIDRRLWVTLINATLRQSYFRINNFDPAGTDASGNFQFYKPEDTKLRLGRTGVETIFKLEPLRYEPLTVYFKNINSNKAEVNTKDGKIQFLVSFEKEDVEISVNCVRNLACGGLGNPQFHVDDLRLNIELEPYAENGKIRYRNANCKISANAGHDGFNFIFTQLEPFTRAMNGPLFDLFSGKITEYLNSPETINDISDQLMSGILANRALLGITGETVYFTQFYVDNDGNIMYNVR
ncbi:hypothetical protein MQX03_07290 [Chryseobacterium aahli]|uniref:hypothetical protein n=1 Tax=Chryseobacterium aahli TaxID=1278643 RepID=UPI001F60B755|nr:hypothetical protein [Chryseobacterium aahli]MCI3936998.1 hypothetical protein [Chryseobacterium aahli]